MGATKTAATKGEYPERSSRKHQEVAAQVTFLQLLVHPYPPICMVWSADMLRVLAVLPSADALATAVIV